MRNVTVAAAQMKCTENLEENIASAERLVREAWDRGAQIVLLQELFEYRYFCQVENPQYYNLSCQLTDDKAVKHFINVAKELQVVLPISFYENKNNAMYNSVAVIDADGSIAGVYRKSHIPDGPGYEEKYYFNSGDTGFKVFNTKYGKIGVAICWDQWFPEAARIMTLKGAEILMYPSAIGSEPEQPTLDSKGHWQRCMIGHAACNLIPVVASNRVGREEIDGDFIDFYGSSFIANHLGEKVCEAGRSEEALITATFDLDEIARQRIEWGVFRDRRPDLYGPILTLDGETRVL